LRILLASRPCHRCAVQQATHASQRSSLLTPRGKLLPCPSMTRSNLCSSRDVAFPQSPPRIALGISSRTRHSFCESRVLGGFQLRALGGPVSLRHQLPSVSGRFRNIAERCRCRRPNYFCLSPKQIAKCRLGAPDGRVGKKRCCGGEFRAVPLPHGHTPAHLARHGQAIRWGYRRQLRRALLAVKAILRIGMQAREVLARQ
jgi:hypothetical protein